MIHQLLSIKIPKHWELIKFATTKADEVDQQDLQPYLNELLHSLLSDKSQCFVRTDKRDILTVLITKIVIDKITNEKYLHLQTMYSFKKVADEVWKTDFEFIKQFKESEKCAYILFQSRNRRIQEIGKYLGFREKHRTFILRGV